MSGTWVSSEEIQYWQSTIKSEDIPVCSLCKEKPDPIGKIVAGRDTIFLCRIALKMQPRC